MRHANKVSIVELDQPRAIVDKCLRQHYLVSRFKASLVSLAGAGHNTESRSTHFNESTGIVGTLWKLSLGNLGATVLREHVLLVSSIWAHMCTLLR